jgi:hypothetical protein
METKGEPKSKLFGGEKVTRLLFYLVITLFAVPLVGTGQRTGETRGDTRRIRLGFTILPVTTRHHQGQGARAALIENTLSMPTVKLVNLPDVPAGTTFARWLRDGSIVVASSRVKSANLGNLDSFVVDPNTGKVVSCLTCSMPKTAAGDYIYNEVPQPLYDVRKPNVVKSFIFAAHYGPLLRDDIDVGRYTQMWEVGPGGKHPKRSLEFHVGMHGCQVSPDGQWFACQPCTDDKARPEPCKGPSEFCEGVVLTKVSPGEGGVHGTACVGNASQWLPNGVVVWRPDSKGFLYFSQKNPAASASYWWNYYDMSSFASGDYQPTKTIAVGVITPDSPVWGPCSSGPTCNPWVYLTVQHTPPRSSTKIKVIARIALDGSGSLDLLTDKLGQDAGPPVISADGSMIAFLSDSQRGTNKWGPQVWVLDLPSKKKPYQLTDFSAESEAAAYSVSWPVK